MPTSVAEGPVVVVVVIHSEPTASLFRFGSCVGSFFNQFRLCVFWHGEEREREREGEKEKREHGGGEKRKEDSKSRSLACLRG